MADEAYEKWLEVSIESYAGSGLLWQNEYFRSAVSRAYYAGYCRLSAALVNAKVTMPTRGNPGHEKLPIMVLDHLSTLSEVRRQNLVGAIGSLYRLRIVADYYPFVKIGIDEARIASGLMKQIFRDAKEADNGSDPGHRQRD